MWHVFVRVHVKQRICASVYSVPAQLFILQVIGAHVKRHDCARSRSLPLLFLPHKDRQNAGQKIQLLASESKETQIHKFFFFLFAHKHTNVPTRTCTQANHAGTHAGTRLRVLHPHWRKKSLFILSKVTQIIMFIDDMFIYIKVSKWKICSCFATNMVKYGNSQRGEDNCKTVKLHIKPGDS